MKPISEAHFPPREFIALRRAEGAAIGLVFSILFWHFSGNWWLFAGLLILPDFAMVGYFVGPRIGALVYNTFHTYVLPGTLGAFGAVLDMQALIVLGLVWMAHIGFDRALGYGLKLDAGFTHTHLSRMQDLQNP